MSATVKRRRYWGWALAAVVAATACALIAQAPLANEALPPGHPRLTEPSRAFKINRPQIEQGTEAAAKVYYQTTVSPHLGFLTDATILESSLTDLLKYFGHDNVAATELHALSSTDLMAKSPDILASSFFAPKISNVSDKGRTPADGYGWRKLTRFKAKAGSKAAETGMEALWFLQNTFVGSPNDDPFDASKNVSLFNQAIAVRKDPPSLGKNAVYFFAYRPLVKTQTVDGKIRPITGPLQEDGKLAFSLKATFDEDDRNPETNLGAKEYFLPDSCAQCHGASTLHGKLNFLDTDHWFDRVTPAHDLPEPKFAQDDFTAIATSPFGVLYDGGKDPATARFKQAFAVIRSLNAEMAEQNRRQGDNNLNFQLQAVKRWLELHAPGPAAERHVIPGQRGFGTEKWDANDVSQRKTLYYLNRYCYRCHSSVRFSVYDLARVRAKASEMRDRLLFVDPLQAGRWMPQDRIVPGLVIGSDGAGVATGDLLEFIELLKKLDSQP